MDRFETQNSISTCASHVTDDSRFDVKSKMAARQPFLEIDEIVNNFFTKAGRALISVPTHRFIWSSYPVVPFYLACDLLVMMNFDVKGQTWINCAVEP